MKKKIVALCMILMIMLTGCEDEPETYEEAVSTESEKETYAGGYFTVESKWSCDNGYCRIVHDDNGVKYFVKSSGYQLAITPLLNPDGTPQLVKEQ